MPDHTTSSWGFRTPEDKKKDPVFDKNDLYEKEVAPILDALHKACLKHEMPLLVVISSSRSAKKVDEENDEVGEDLHIAGATGPDGYVPSVFLLSMKMLTSNQLFKKIITLARLLIK